MANKTTAMLINSVSTHLSLDRCFFFVQLSLVKRNRKKNPLSLSIHEKGYYQHFAHVKTRLRILVYDV